MMNVRLDVPRDKNGGMTNTPSQCKTKLAKLSQSPGSWLLATSLVSLGSESSPRKSYPLTATFHLRLSGPLE